MQPTSQPISDDIRSTLSGINNVITLLQSKLPTTSYIQAFLAVARHENESVDYYAKICGCSSGAMSRRLSELGDVSSRNRKPGYGLLENPFNPMDRRLRMVRLSAKGKALVAQIAAVMNKSSGYTYEGLAR
jgi:DNA-binding MarR family transcriptional regulator